MDRTDHVENTEINESVEPRERSYEFNESVKPRVDNNDFTNVAESSEENESVEQSGDTMEDIHLNGSVKPSSVYGTHAESSEENESVELSACLSANMPVIHDNSETPASDASGNSSDIDLNTLFGESNGQMESESREQSQGDGENVSSINSESSQTTKPRNVIKCPLCPGQDTHSIWKCGTFKCLNLDGRWKKAKELGLCFRCLQCIWKH